MRISINQQISFLFGITIYFISCKSGNEFRRKEYNRLIGTYRIDTNLCVLEDYQNSLYLYSDLFLTLKADCTYFQNKRVPFIEDTFGRWNSGPGEFETYNYICGNTMIVNGNYHLDVGTQFSYIDKDSTIGFLISDSVPNRFGQCVVFRKCLQTN